MIQRLIVLLLAIGIVLIAAPAQADWDVGDPYKMHYPQLPDPFGWDIDITRGFVADDWLCTETGPVNDVHFWISWQGGNVGIVDGVWVRIWSDVPANTDIEKPWSHPGELLWDYIFDDGFTVRQPPELGDQGWYTLAKWNDGTNPIIAPNDHQEYYQVNIDDIASVLPVDKQPFEQVRDTTYWLELHIIPEVPQTYAGWKTSLDKWNDDAVWEDMSNHYELLDPLTGASLDMAFVITPEPASIALLTIGALALIRRR